MPFAQWESSCLGYQHEERFRGPVMTLDRTAIRDLARASIEKFDVRPPSCDLKTANFSGGNQQKIVIAREMERDPDVLLVGQPTRGVDIGAIEFIHQQIVALRDRGKAILLVSVELDEIQALIGPDHRDVRRSDLGRAGGRGDRRARAGAADGRDRPGGEGGVKQAESGGNARVIELSIRTKPLKGEWNHGSVGRISTCADAADGRRALLPGRAAPAAPRPPTRAAGAALRGSGGRA